MEILTKEEKEEKEEIITEVAIHKKRILDTTDEEIDAISF